MVAGGTGGDNPGIRGFGGKGNGNGNGNAGDGGGGDGTRPSTGGSNDAAGDGIRPITGGSNDPAGDGMTGGKTNVFWSENLSVFDGFWRERGGNSGTPGRRGSGGTSGGTGKSGTVIGGRIPSAIGGKNGAGGSGSDGGKPFSMKSFWLHNSGLNVKKPAEKMCAPDFFDLK